LLRDSLNGFFDNWVVDHARLAARDSSNGFSNFLFLTNLVSTFTNHLYRSVDCARTWKQIYLNSDPTVEFTSMAIDFYNPLNLYMGDTAGNVMKSIDGGISWRVLKDLNKPIGQVVLSPKDSRQVFVATKDAHLFSFQSNTNTNPQTSADIDANFAVDNWTRYGISSL
jgi:photosystem II stability/assembly factor-like uncharacterized protein